MRALTILPIYLFGLCGALFVGCTEQANQKVVSLKAISPKSKKKHEHITVKNNTDTLNVFLNYYANDSANLQITGIQLNRSNTPLFLDRFSSKTQHFILADQSAQQFEFRKWEFKDSSACLDAFYNWLDQAGNNKASVPLLSGSVHSSRFNLLLVAQKELLLIESERAIAYQKWLLWHSGTETATTCRYILYAQPKKRTKWFKYSFGKTSVL